MNFALVVVVIAVVSGISSEIALRSVAPQSGPTLALFIMAIAILAAAAFTGRKRAGTSPRPTVTGERVG